MPCVCSVVRCGVCLGYCAVCSVVCVLSCMFGVSHVWYVACVVSFLCGGVLCGVACVGCCVVVCGVSRILSGIYVVSFVWCSVV